MAIIAFDFDGTITVDNMYPFIGKLRENIGYCISRLAAEGHKIIIFTCRDTQTRQATKAYNDMLNFLDDNVIPYHTINSNVTPNWNFNPRKVYADVYVDDRALGWDPNWTGMDIYDLIRSTLMSFPSKPVVNHTK